jgi:mRNA interferase MazF
MNEGDVILTPLPQADGKVKPRPAVALREMPPYGDFLVCGVSTQLHQAISGFDDLITGQDDDFAGSGLMTGSLIRLGFLGLLPRKNILGSIGAISPERYRRLPQRLSAYLVENLKK